MWARPIRPASDPIAGIPINILNAELETANLISLYFFRQTNWLQLNKRRH